MDFLIFRFFIIFIFFQISIFGEIYILSYKIVTKNSVVATESLYISQLMVPSKQFKVIQRMELDSEDRDNNRYIIKKNRENILDVLFKRGIIINDFTTALNLQGSSQTTIILPPIHISINRLNNDSYLTILKEID